MDNEAYASALKNTLWEIQKICPEVKNAFVFKDNGEIVTGDTSTPEKTIVRAMDIIDNVLEKGEAIGGIDEVILDAEKGRVSVSFIHDLYFVMVTSSEADLKYADALMHVLIPTMLKLIDQIEPTVLEDKPQEAAIESTEHFESKTPLEEDFSDEEESEPDEETAEKEVKPEPTLPEPEVSQFIVENIGGLLVPADVVRVGNDTLSKWKEEYNDVQIDKVDIETFQGKLTRCKVKPIKDSRLDGKGIIQMPDKVQVALEIKKGELVRVKPVLE